MKENLRNMYHQIACTLRLGEAAGSENYYRNKVCEEDISNQHMRIKDKTSFLVWWQQQHVLYDNGD